ncbi:MAG: hypothetical protein LBJ86_00585 [Spirochaetaceae bacterium]|nr:hypothetical protein [Spirochaetaceae bacterium]
MHRLDAHVVFLQGSYLSVQCVSITILSRLFSVLGTVICIFLRVVLPLMATPLITVAVIQFVQIWGSFLWPTLVAGTRWKPVSVLIAGLLGDGSWLEGRVKITALLLSGIPPLTAYLFFQRHIVEGIATSGLKG